MARRTRRTHARAFKAMMAPAALKGAKARHMTLKTMAPRSNDPKVSVPAMAV
jgi:hypothetical protein